MSATSVLAFKSFLNKIACDCVHVRAALERCIKIFIKQNGIRKRVSIRRHLHHEQHYCCCLIFEKQFE